MKKQYDYLIPFAAAFLIMVGLITGSNINEESSGNPDFDSKEKLNDVYDKIISDYVDEVDDKELVQEAVKSMIKELDPHSVYIPAEEVEEANEPLEGQFEGIGVQFDIIEDTITVVSPISGGPSEELGIQSGDKIIKIEGENVAGVGYTNQDVMNSLRGEKGTEVTVHIQRRGAEDLLEFNITRDQIPIHSVDASYMIDDRSGYIRVNRFSSSTTREFLENLTGLKEEGMVNLVLDLRSNPGGYLNASIQMADQFLENNQKIVYTEGRARPKQTFNASRRGNHKEGRLIVLIDEASASASEIVSGAVQDWDRGLVIGQRSFGKGLVQEPFELKDGSAIRLTVSRYYTPTGRSIQRPYDMDDDEYREEWMKRFIDEDEDEELDSRDDLDMPDSLAYETPGGRTVYGGGGITPDILIERESLSDFHVDLRRNRLMSSFGFNYFDDNHEELEGNYEDFETFSEEFDGAQLEEEFISFVQESEVEFDEEAWEEDRKQIINEYTRPIARQLFDIGHIRLSNQMDPVFERAVEALYDDTFEEHGVN